MGAGTAGATDAVRVVHRRTRQVVVDDGRQVRHVDAARGQVGGHQNRQQALVKVGQHLAAPALAELAVQRRRGQAGLAQLVSHLLAGMLRGDEDQHPRPAFSGNEVAQERCAARAVNDDGALVDGAGRGGLRRRLRRCQVQPQRVAQHLFSQCMHAVWQRGRKQRRLALCRHGGQQAAHFIGKAQVQQAVGFVQHQQLQVAQVQRVLCEQVQEPSGCGHHPVRAAAQRHHLRVDRQATYRYHAFQVGRQATADAGDLLRQFTRRRQHQGAQPTRRLGALGLYQALQQALQQRQQIRRRFARARGRQRQHIAALQQRGDGRSLHGGGVGPAGVGSGLRQRRQKA